MILILASVRDRDPVGKYEVNYEEGVRFRVSAITTGATRADAPPSTRAAASRSFTARASRTVGARTGVSDCRMAMAP